jgi:cytoskeletal protein RodZ
MALEDTDAPDGGLNDSNGDEQSNRTFRLLALGLGGIAVLGLIVIGAIFLTRQGERANIQATSAAIEATNQAITQLAAITPTPPPTDTPVPTSTSVPPSPTLPPTAVPTKAPTNTPSAGVTSEATAKPGSTSGAATSAPKATASSGVTTTTTTTSTVGGGETQVPKTGAGDSLGVLALAAGLVVVFVVARRLRTSNA